MKLQTLRTIFREAREKDLADKRYKKLVGDRLNYMVLQDIANIVSNEGIVVEVGPMKDGSYIRMSTKPHEPHVDAIRQRLSQDPTFRAILEGQNGS